MKTRVDAGDAFVIAAMCAFHGPSSASPDVFQELVGHVQRGRVLKRRMHVAHVRDRRIAAVGARRV
jgi:hypothetical protein